MLPWKILGWIALSILIASVIAASAAGYALYSTGSDAVHALAAPHLDHVRPAPVSAATATPAAYRAWHAAYPHPDSCADPC